MSAFTWIVVILVFCILLMGVYIALRRHYGDARPYASRQYWQERFRDHHRELIDMTEQVHSALMAHGITYWMHDGTLLGAVRHGGMIPWDDDIDLVVYAESFTGFHEKWEQCKRYLTRLGFQMQPEFFGWQLWKSTFDRHIDLFFFKRTLNTPTNQVWLVGTPACQIQWPKEYHVESEMFPLRLYKFDRLQLYGPRNPWEFLSHCFSPQFYLEGRLDSPHCMKWTEKLLYPIPKGQRMEITGEEQQWAQQFSPGNELWQTLVGGTAGKC